MLSEWDDEFTCSTVRERIYPDRCNTRSAENDRFDDEIRDGTSFLLEEGRDRRRASTMKRRFSRRFSPE